MADTKNRKKRLRRLLALILAAVMCGTAVTVPSAAEEAETAAETEAAETSAAEDGTEISEIAVEAADVAETAEAEESSTINADMLSSSASSRNSYSNYIKNYTDAEYPDAEIAIEAKDYVSTEASGSLGESPEIEITDYEGTADCLLWTNHGGDVTYSFKVEKEGLYNLEALYFPISGDNTTVEVALLLDGEYPFTAAKTFTLDRYWKDESAIKKDNKDNDLRPKQTEYDCWVTYPIKDKEGLFNTPYFFYLTKGEHKMTVRGIKVNTAFKSFTFKNYPELVTYDSVKPTEEQINATPALTQSNILGSNTIFIQGENAAYKTASTLYPTFDRTSYLVSPSHPTKQRYNTIGLDTWNKATQTITWAFSVPNDGYYKIDVKARQKKNRGFYTYRRVYIDGSVPFDAFDCQKFKYSDSWYMQSLCDENGDAAYVYLTAGNHEISMEAIPGSIGAVMQRLDELVYTLNYYYRRILMITGPSPDEYNDYFVDRQIPELISVFEDAIEKLYSEKAGIESLSSTKGSAASTLETMAITLQRCIDERDEIPSMLSTVKDSISAVSAWMRDYRDQPLEIDYIEVSTSHETASNADENFFSSMAFMFNSFLGSFFEDYTVMSEGTAKSLNVWVSLGRDQATVVKELVDNDFNINSGGIEASINLVQGAILEATLAGKGPEIALFIGGDFPIQLAARGLLVDLTQFNDYEEVAKDRFTDTISTLYTYNGGIYGLPVSQDFPMLFYRTDILEELGIEPPETWQELIDVLPILQRKYLEVGLLSPTSNLSSSVFDAGDTFICLLEQQGISVYNEDLTATNFDKIASQDVFELWTKFYSTYSFDQTYDAFSRFRTGEMPLVIQNYTFYNQLSVSAPEIKGLWDFTLVPGTAQSDGTINHTVNSGSAGAIIFEKVSDTQAAWQFIKWFTSNEVQVEYGRSIEALMGPMGRFNTANVQALKQLPWSTAEYEKISSQMSQTQEVPIIPASYATTRHVKNAFRAVVNDYWWPRYALSSYNRDINAEIARKNSELSSFDEN